MTVSELIPTVRDALTVRRVFGEPYERDGVTVIPAAVVRGGGGGGSGRQGGEQEGEGEGGGFGLIARPAGALVVKDGEVTWQPAVDVNRVVGVGVLGWVVVSWLVARAVRRRG
ncbi:spore germination protein GerW family protein [Blastococcus sp. SYSU D00669]